MSFSRGIALFGYPAVNFFYYDPARRVRLCHKVRLQARGTYIYVYLLSPDHNVNLLYLLRADVAVRHKLNIYILARLTQAP